MPIIGTAGHVDHGKSTLVLALTGRDPDRWEEEKRRGLTIDLGFAWAELPGSGEVGFVDVPGHERFIKNMLAGIEAVDVALLVVAADEGWMPQSEEHLAVLDLLDVAKGVVAVTKVDRVDADLLELVLAEVEERLAGSALHGSPIVPVSVPEGVGVETLRESLGKAVAEAPAPRDIGRPRLWVDRSFTISGAGTVVTGTLLDGSLQSGEHVALWPGERAARIRNLESHERRTDRAVAGNRVAVNLAGLERQEVDRGAMLGKPGQWLESSLALVELRTARYLEEPLTEKGAFHLHVGSGGWPIRLRLLKGDRLEGTGAALVRLPRPLPLQMGDRFILREVGRRAVVAGGQVLDPGPPNRPSEVRNSMALLRAALSGPADSRADALLEVRGHAPLQALRAQSAGGQPQRAAIAGEMAVSSKEARRITEQAVRLVEEYHLDNPLRPGMPKASLASRLRVPLPLLENLVERSAAMSDRAAFVARADFRSTLGEEGEQAWEELRSALLGADLAVPRLSELRIDGELLHALLRDGRLVRISEELVYLPEQLAGLSDRMAVLPEQFTVAQFRDALGVTRKYAVPLLEWLDSTGVTRRAGDLRRLRKPGPARAGSPSAPSQ